MSERAYMQKLLKSLGTFLDRWNGGNAAFWEYRKAHSMLAIRITSDDRPGKNLHIACLGPVYVQGPFAWSASELQGSIITLDDGQLGYLLTDKSAGFLIRTEALEVKENCKPL